MASVRMSNNLRKEIINAGKSLFLKSLEKIRGSFAKDYHDRAAQEFVTQKFIPRMSDMPTEYLERINRVTYNMPYTVSEGGKTIEYAWSEEILINPIKIIKIYGFYSEGMNDKYKILTIPDKFNFSQELQNELSDWRGKIRACNAEETAFIDEIKRITGRCNTVKQFLDTWPQGENLIPADKLRAFNTKPEKREKVPIITEEASITLSATLLKRTIMS